MTQLGTTSSRIGEARRLGSGVMLAGMMPALMLGLGCRAHPISLTMTLVGDVVDQIDVEELEPLLIGENSATADDTFGPRHDTLLDQRGDGKWLVYADHGEKLVESFYVVELCAEDRITNLFKCKRNIDGLEDLQKVRDLERHTIGAKRAECEEALDAGEPIYHMLSTATGYDAWFYDVRNLTHTRQARYCILCFDPNGNCWEVRMLGVTAD